jgi:FkbM family methyltransferase
MVGFSPLRVIQVRRLIPGADRAPLVVTSPEGLRLRLTSDPLDEQIAEDVFRRHRWVYFPESAPSSVHLVLDIGAHHGHYSLLATSMYPNAKVVAVEPAPVQASALRRNVALNGLQGRIEVRQCALAESAGRATLHLDGSGSWGNTLFRPTEAAGDEAVEAEPLSSLVRDRVPEVIKCNAEGAEFTLVDQLSLLATLPPLLVLMAHPEHGDVSALGRRLEALGYEVAIALGGDHPTWHCRLASHAASAGQERGESPEG